MDYENVCFPIIIFFIVKIVTVQGEWKNERKSKVPFHALNGIKGACVSGDLDNFDGRIVPTFVVRQK